MSKHTNIQWTDSAINPVMGCDGCELWPTIGKLVNVIASESGISKDEVRKAIADLLPTDVYHRRHELAQQFAPSCAPIAASNLAEAIRKCFVCYAGELHLFRGKDDTKPDKRTNSGYAPKFEIPTLFAGRMAEAAKWSDLSGVVRPESPWKRSLPRTIFVSDMGDALSNNVPFTFLRDEIITHAASENGRRHIWLWLSKRPHRMAEFSEWLADQHITWPDNLVAMTSVTSNKMIGRVDQLRKVRCKIRGLSVEPLWTPVNLQLEGIDWAIVGGESGRNAKPFQIEWAQDIIRQCRQAGVAPFVKQLGAAPFEGSRPLKFRDSHGGDWDEWPEDLRVREFPAAFSTVIK